MKNKRKIFVYILFVFVLLGISGCNKNHDENKEMTYKSYVSNFTSINFEEIQIKINQEDDFILYTGRESCSYCKLFVPKLYDAVKKVDLDVFYWDVENVDLELVNIDQFLSAYGINYTPSLIKFHNKDNFENFEIDSNKIKADDIILLLK